MSKPVTPGGTTPIEGESRAGSRLLEVLENPLNARVLRIHADGPKRLGDLQERVGWSAQTTVRAAVVNLRELGALGKQAIGDSSQMMETTLTPAGLEMLCVADEVEAWLALCPNGPIDPDGEEARAAIKALAGGWSSTLMRALANRSFTLAELTSLIPDISYPALERRVSWMRVSGQIEPVKSSGRGTPYVVTNWLRRSIAPLSVAGRCERRHLRGKGGPITDIEVETSFLLTIPLLRLPDHASGTCMLAVQTDPVESDVDAPPLAGVTIDVQQGVILDCDPEVATKPKTWAVGTAEAWLDAVIDGQIQGLRVGGARPQLALDLVCGIHHALFGRSGSS